MIYKLTYKVMNVSIRKVENGFTLNFWEELNSGSATNPGYGRDNTFVYATLDEAVVKLQSLFPANATA